MNRVFLTVLLWLVYAGANAALTNAAGGKGGVKFWLDCPTSFVLVGIKGRSGSLIDKLQGVCRRFDSAGNPIGAPVDTGSVGGSGGGAFSRICASDRVVSGFRVHAGTKVDQIIVECRIMGPDDVLQGATYPLTKVGGEGGNAATLRCANNRPARHLTGRAKRYGAKRLQRIQLDCGSTEPKTYATGFFSSGDRPQVCRRGYFISALECKGSNCRRLKMWCKEAIGVQISDHAWTKYASEESGDNFASCPSQHYGAGIACTGKRCDNLSIYCVKATNVIGTSNTTLTGWFSEEQSRMSLGAGYFIRHIECKGSYCDNKRIRKLQLHTTSSLVRSLTPLRSPYSRFKPTALRADLDE